MKRHAKRRKELVDLGLGRQEAGRGVLAAPGRSSQAPDVLT
uniref:Uncharacterized protein n=1 Tax=Arundo donax TaxID=35708 RepID=A0A0A9ASS7_ARUDO